MSVKIVCPHCDKEFDNWEPYANHILEKHPADKERCVWAERALEAGSEILPEQHTAIPQLETADPTHNRQSPRYYWNKEKHKWLERDLP